MAQQLKVFTATMDDLSFIPRATWWSEKSASTSCLLTSTCTPLCKKLTHTYSHIYECKKKKVNISRNVLKM